MKSLPSRRTGQRPGRTLAAFAALLVVLFGGSFTAGRLAGSLSPGPGPGSHGTNPGPDMPGMPGMQMDGLRPVTPPEVSR